MPSLTEPLEFIFIDAVKEEYPDYLPHAVRLLRPGGVDTASLCLNFHSSRYWSRIWAGR